MQQIERRQSCAAAGERKRESRKRGRSKCKPDDQGAAQILSLS
jgi:hypothetical protein